MFERFTDRARRVVVLAQEEARMLNHNYIGTEHILLGLIHEGEGVAAKGLESLGAKAHIEHGYVIAEAPHGLTGADVVLDFPSVGATENIMTAAVLAKGVTTIDNAAREPDIVDLCEFLVSMGAKIEGIGSPLITITGVEKLNPTSHRTITDRIIAGTWAFAAAMTQGDITIHGGRADHMEVMLEKLTSAGAIITSTDDGIRVRMDSRPQSIDVSTLPYPGFPTDLLPMVIALNSIATGDAIVTENVFESRFMFVNELLRLGAKIQVNLNIATTIHTPAQQIPISESQCSYLV